MLANQRPSLYYASRSTDQQVVYCQTEGGATVVIHEPGRRSKAASEVAGSFIAETIGGLAAGGWLVYFWLKSLGWMTVVAIGVGIEVVVFTLASLHYRKLARPVVIELTPTQLIIANLDAKGPQIYPRERIYAIKYVTHSKNFVVRAHGCQMFEHHFELAVERVEEIARFLRVACKLEE